MLTDDDGIDAPFERAITRAIRSDRKRLPPPPCAECGQPMKASQATNVGDAWVHRACKETMQMAAASQRARWVFGIEDGEL